MTSGDPRPQPLPVEPPGATRATPAIPDGIPAVLWEADVDNAAMTFVSASAIGITGYPPSDWLADPAFWETHVHRDDLAEAAHAVAGVCLSGETERLQYRFRQADGTYRWFDDTLSLVQRPGEPRRLAGVMVPRPVAAPGDNALAERRAADAVGGLPAGDGSSIFRAVVDALAEGVYCTDLNRRVTYWNRGAERLTGRAGSDVLGRQCHDDVICHFDEHGTVQCGQCPLFTALGHGCERTQVLWIQHAAGHLLRVRVHAAPLHDAAGRVVGAVETFGDAVDDGLPDRRVRAADSDPFADPHTGLPDRRLLDAVLAARKDDLDRYLLPYGLLIVEVDRLGETAAEHGPVAAAHLLRAVAWTIRASLRTGDVLVRWGPSQLAVGVGMIEVDGMAVLADRLVGLARQTTVAGRPGSVLVGSVSVGGTIALRGEPLEGLCSRAERAVAEARRGGRDRAIVVGPTRRAPRTLGHPSVVA